MAASELLIRIKATQDPRFCEQCGGYGVWMTPRHVIAECPGVTLGRHEIPTQAARSLIRAGVSIARRGIIPLTNHFDIARALTGGTSAMPIERDRLIRKYFGAGSGSLRRFHRVIEELRADWWLPVASRKDEPHGYWISTDEADFREWVERAKSAPVRQLSTISAVAKANFPVFAEQLELEFWKDLSPADVAGCGQAAVSKSTS